MSSLTLTLILEMQPVPIVLSRGTLYLVFTAERPCFHLGGRAATTRGKDEVCPSPDGSIVSGGTVAVTPDFKFYATRTFVGLQQNELLKTATVKNNISYSNLQNFQTKLYCKGQSD